MEKIRKRIATEHEQLITQQLLFPAVSYKIQNELIRAIHKHPNYPKNKFEQLAILHEEIGEVTKAVLQLEQENKGSLQDIESELIQSAAMCIRMLFAISNEKRK